jgi:aryl-alcohol dehydrogenase-like predicted oxidoreductase
MKELTKLVLGTAQMGLEYGINNKSGKIDLRKSLKILDYAFENGIRTLDTAEVYGTAHYVISEYHKLHPNNQFNIITKLPKSVRLETVKSKIDQYLNDLRISNIHLLMYHDFETYRQDHELAIHILTSLKSDNVKRVGVSVYTNDQIMDILNDEKKVDVIQLPYNLLDNKFQRGFVLEKMKMLRVAAHTRSPFLQGMFFLDDKSNNEAFKYLSFFINELKGIANSSGVSLQALALLYSYLNKLSESVILGVDSIEQLKVNLDIISNQFISNELVALVDRIEVQNTDLLNPSLWK